MSLRLLDLFAGIGGFSYAAEALLEGFHTVQFVELDPFCQKVLRKHWPCVPIHDDIRTFTPAAGIADVITAGFPCQDISVAGKGAGIRPETRSGLFFEAMRIVRLVRPRFVVLENVPAIRSRGLDVVLGELAAAGFDAEWACLSAHDLGACHQRERWWCVAYRPTEVGGRGPGTAQSNAGAPQARLLPNANGERLQEQHPSTFPSNSRQPSWIPPAERLRADWKQFGAEPVVRRGGHGIPKRVDRLKALGNAVVPQVAAVPLRRVLQLASQ